MALLEAEERKRIEAAIAAAEARTSGEIVVAVVPASADYAPARAAAALVVAIGLAIGAHHLWPGIAEDWVLLALVPASAALYAAWGVGPLLRLLVGPRHADHAARVRAEQLFAHHGLYRTREGTGVLILLSEREHRVVMLGDRGVQSVLGDEGLRAHVGDLSRAVAAGRAVDGLVGLVGSLADVLSPRFPRRPDDVNEIPDRVLDER